MMKCGFVRTRTPSVRYQIANLSSDIHRYPALYTPKQRLTAAVMRKSALMCRKCASVANCFLSSTIRSILTSIAAVVTISRTGALPACDWKTWKNFMYKKEEQMLLFFRFDDWGIFVISSAHAQTYLRQAVQSNPGPWEQHSFSVADNAKRIAQRQG